jgi:heme-degrading monooxygenase HmoA
MVWTSGTWRVIPGHESAFIDAWEEFARWSQEAFGDTTVWLLRDRTNPTIFISIGPWPSDEVIARWRESAGFRERVRAIRQLLVAFEPRTMDEVLAIA